MKNERYIVVAVEESIHVEELLNEYDARHFRLCCVFSFQNEIVCVFEREIEKESE
jgi:hypothetical protein